MKIYVSGPMTGYADYNCPAFNRVAANLRAQGFEVINPAEINDGSTGTYDQWMREDIRLLLDCDAIYLLNGWEKSRGAGVEARVAKVIGLKFLYEGEWVERECL